MCLIALLFASLKMMIDDEAEYDRQFMKHCLALARQARKLGEFPFVGVVVRDGKIISEAINEVARERDVTRHAEMVAISRAQRATGGTRLRGCAIYASVEPCAMCSLAIRAARVDRVVYALTSPFMGGASKWNILSDEELSGIMPEYFGRRPPGRQAANGPAPPGLEQFARPSHAICDTMARGAGARRYI